MNVLRSESPSGKCSKPRTVAASNYRDHPTRASPNQRNANGEDATTSPPFYHEPHWHVLFVKAAPGTSFTSWSQDHFVASGKPERHVRKTSSCGSKQQQRSPSEITLLLLVRATYTWVLFFAHILCVVNRTFNATPTERLQQEKSFYLLYVLYKAYTPPSY